MNSAERLVERARGGDRAAWAELLPEGWLERTDGPSTSTPAVMRRVDARPERAPKLPVVAMIVVAAISTIALVVIMLTSPSGPDAERTTQLAQRQAAPIIDYIAPTDTTGPIQGASASPRSPAKVPPAVPTRRTTKAPRTSKPAPPAPTPPPFSALAGFRCPETATSGFTERPGTDGWYLVTGGGWTGNGCRGHMVAMPMSDNSRSDDLRNLMLWWFRMPARADCGVEVYIPRTENVRDAAGEPATYFVYGTSDGSGSRIDQFDIDQVHNQGRWVAVGRFPATSGQLSVRLMNRGVSDIPGARLGGSAVRVSC